MSFLVVSSSLNPDSRSRILAKEAHARFEAHDRSADFIDLTEVELPLCDGAKAYEHPEVHRMQGLVKNADGILLAAPIYNYDVNAAAKNLVELTGRAWTGKAVGFLCAAGGRGSYMSLMGLANSLMLDFRCVIVPRFVYGMGEHFEANALSDEDLTERIDEVVRSVIRLSDACAE